MIYGRHGTGLSAGERRATAREVDRKDPLSLGQLGAAAEREQDAERERAGDRQKRSMQ